MRNSTLTLLSAATAVMAFGLTVLDSAHQRAAAEPALKLRSDMVSRLGLSDLALFTEARYIRHLALADRHAPFQDHPSSFEHFPSGSIILPPAHLSP